MGLFAYRLEIAEKNRLLNRRFCELTHNFLQMWICCSVLQIAYVPFKEDRSLEHAGSMWSAVSILMRDVIDPDHQCSSATTFFYKIFRTMLLAKMF
jgi:hypothetical protein